MFCSKCGKELVDEALICPHCGCGTSNFNRASQPQSAPVSTHSEHYPALKAFSDEAKNLQTLGILSAVFCFGIGIIFAIAIWVKQGFLPQDRIPNLNLTLPDEIAEFESAKKRWMMASNLTALPVVAIIVCGAIVVLVALS